MTDTTVYVGLDVHKDAVAAAITAQNRSSPRYLPLY